MMGRWTFPLHKTPRLISHESQQGGGLSLGEWTLWREMTSVVCTATRRRGGEEVVLVLVVLPCVRKMRRKKALPPPWAREESSKFSPCHRLIGWGIGDGVRALTMAGYHLSTHSPSHPSFPYLKLDTQRRILVPLLHHVHGHQYGGMKRLLLLLLLQNRAGERSAGSTTDFGQKTDHGPLKGVKLISLLLRSRIHIKFQ